jgi:hypothetical protein
MCFIAQGQIAEKDHHYGEAANHYLDAIRLGVHGLKDGVLIDRMVGNACERIGTQPLKTLVERLSVDDCREAIAALQELEKEREPMEKTLLNEKQFAQGQSSFSQQIAALITFRSQRKVVNKVIAGTDACILLERQTLLALAARAFELEHGKAPTRAEELVPDYLKSLPQDPETKTNLAL